MIPKSTVRNQNNFQMFYPAGYSLTDPYSVVAVKEEPHVKF